MIRTKKVLKSHRLDKRSINVLDYLMELSKSNESQAEISRYIYNKGLLALAGKLRFDSDESFQSSFAEAMEERLADYEALEPLEKKSANLLGRKVQGSLVLTAFAVVVLAVVLVLVLLSVVKNFGM